MQHLKTAPSRSARGGRRRGALRNSSASDDDTRKAKDARKVHFNVQSQAGNGSSASPSAPAGQRPTRGGPSARARAASSSTRAGAAGTKRGNPPSQIKTHLGTRSNPQQASTPSSRSQGQGIEERLQSLKAYREQEISHAVANGTLSQPGKQMSLSEAITLVGTCQDMCPEIERVRRIREGGVFKEEKDEHNEPDEAKMVKAFHRSSAGDEVQIPSDLRPPQILKSTLDYLVSGVIGNAPNFGVVHHFVWDRTRAIRNDFSIQQVSRVEDVEIAIDTFERCARFHILALHTLSTAKHANDTSTYSAQQDREQLDKTLLSLIQFYEDNRGRVDCRNESEFRAYQILFAIQSPTPNLEDRIQAWGADVVRSPRVQAALRLYQAACTTDGPQGPLRPYTNHKIAQEHWRRFWHLIDSSGTSFLMACIAEIYFPLIRHRALTSIWLAYRTKGVSKHVSSDWALDDLRGALGFETEDEVQDYVESAGFTVSESESGIAVLDLHSVTGEVPDPGLGRNPSGTVERKRHGRTFPAVINGLTVREARRFNMIESSVDEDAEESLFIPDDRPQPSRSAPFNPTATSFSPFGGSADKKDNTWSQAQGIQFAKPSFGTGFGAPGPASGSSPTSNLSSQQTQHSSLFSRMQSQLSSGDFSSRTSDQPQGSKPPDDETVQHARRLSQNQKMEEERRIAEESAKQRAKEAAARAAEEQKRLAEENERRRVAEEALQRRAAEEAEARRLTELREMAERERRAEQRRAEELAAQAVQARKAERSEVLDKLAQRLVYQANDGFLDQFIQYITEPMIIASRDELLHQKNEEEATRFRLARLSKKYGLMWRNICWKMRLARQGRERRRRQKESVQAKLRAQRSGDQAMSPVSRERIFADALAFSPDRHISSAHGRSQVDGLTDRSTASMPPPPLPAAHHGETRSEKARKSLTSAKPQPHRATSSYIDPSALLRSQHSHRQSMQTSQGPDKTTSSYFHLKAMGIQPTTNMLPPAKDPSYYRRQRSGSKRAREEDSDAEQEWRGSRLGSVESTSAPLSEASLPRKRQANEFEVSRTGLDSSTSSNGADKKNIGQLLEEARLARQAMSDTVDFFRDEVQEMKRASAQSSRRSSFSTSPHAFPPGLDLMSHPAFQDSDARSVVSVASNTSSRRTPGPLKYRSRTSKFLPREDYADARIRRGLSGSASPYTHSSHAHEYAPRRHERAEEQSRRSTSVQRDFSAALPQETASTSDATRSVVDTDPTASTDGSRPQGIPSQATLHTQLPVNSQNLVSLSSSFSLPGNPSFASDLEAQNGASEDLSGPPTVDMQSAQPRSEALTSSPARAPNGIAFDASFSTGTQSVDVSNGAIKGVSPPPLKRKAPEEAHGFARAVKARRKSPPPRNLNRFALLAGDVGDDETEEDSDGLDNQDEERGSSVGFTSEDDDGHVANGGQGNDYGTGEQSDEEGDEPGSTEGSYDDEADGGDGGVTSAAQADWGSKGGTSMEDAIEL